MSDAGTGLIVACYGNRGHVDTGSGNPQKYILRGKRLRAVCGDRVQWESQPDEDTLLVTSLEERENALERADARGLPETIAANLSRLVIVMAGEPAPDWFITDRYLCAAELLEADAVLVWNKQDLTPAPAEFSQYAELGYAAVSTAATEGTGIASLAQLLDNGISMLVGQSGVGKSSLINGLLPDANVATSEVSTSNREGKHTTTASVMHTLTNGGRLIDSPGVRDFAPAIRDIQMVQQGFREIAERAPQCRFNNCRHLREPDCAVKSALANDEIRERRYESYKRLMNTVSGLADPKSG